MNSAKKTLLPTSDEITSAIESSEEKCCWDLSSIFGDKANKTNSEGWRLLQQVFNFRFKSSNIMEPFGPMTIMDGKRSIIPDDLTDTQLDELLATLESVTDPEYLARVSDIIWLRSKDVKAARVAVNAYLEAGKRTEHPKNWTTSMERYERALRLARQIEPKGDLPNLILAHLESQVIHYDGKDPLYFTHKALALLAEFRYGNFSSLAGIAESVAKNSLINSDFHRARSYFDVQAKHLKLAGQSDTAETVRVNSARTFTEEAENREAKEEFMAAHAVWSDAISAFRDRPSLRKEIPELQRRYSIAGEKLLDEMSQVKSDGMDISKYVEESRANVRNLPWEDAFFALVSFAPLIDPTELRKTTEKGISENPLQATVDMNYYDASGRKTGIRPSVYTEDPTQYEKAITGFMEQNAAIHRQITVQAHIMPALSQIIEDHEITKKSFSPILDDSALIPEERRDWFYQAFEAGFRGDISTSLHLLIPQIENALRHVLQDKGIAPVNIDNVGIEEVWGLERILNHPKILEVFGGHFVFALTSLLIERLGPNFRNLFAHGALPPNSFQGADAFYLWWLIMRLAAYPTSRMRAYVERRSAN